MWTPTFPAKIYPPLLTRGENADTLEDRMNRREAQDLDRHITGNWGEDQLNPRGGRGGHKRDYIQVNMPGSYSGLIDEIADTQARDTGHERMNRSETVRYAIRLAAATQKTLAPRPIVG